MGYSDYMQQGLVTNWSASEQDRLRKLSELLAMQQDNSEPGVQYDTGNQQFLSALSDPQNSIRTTGFDENFMSGNQHPAPLPQNFIRNERTGAVTDLGQSQPSRPALDYTMPIEMAGIGKGYRLKGDATRAVMADGRIIDMGRDTGRDRTVEKENLALQKARLELDQLQAKPTSALDAARAKVLADVEGEQLKAKIPGTAENERIMKRDAGEKKEQSAWSGSIKQADTMDDYIDRVLGTGNYEGKGSKLGYFATGLPGQVLENFGGTDARNLRGDLDRIKANIGFEELNKMRRESLTGGALGQVTERELQFLQSVQGSLDQAQTPEQLERMLWDIKNSTMRLKQDLKANPPKGFSGGSAAASRAPVSGAESQAMLMQEAQAAIAAGAPREAVMQRLQERMGR